jgi:hypothetical protein
MGWADAYGFELAGQVVHGGFTLGRTTAIGSGKYTTTDGESITFLLSVHRLSQADQGKGRLLLTWKGSLVLTIPFQAQWNGATLTGTGTGIWVTQPYGAGTKYVPLPAYLSLTVNIGT